jgi:DNA-binding transcriptional ArsR family regulator
MDVEKVVKALNSRTRRKILKILSEGPKNVKEVSIVLREQYSANIKYRESVFKALEKLVEADLVEKFYEKDKGIAYRLKRKKVTIDLIKEVVK